MRPRDGPRTKRASCAWTRKDIAKTSCEILIGHDTLHVLYNTFFGDTCNGLSGTVADAVAEPPEALQGGDNLSEFISECFQWVVDESFATVDTLNAFLEVAKNAFLEGSEAAARRRTTAHMRNNVSERSCGKRIRATGSTYKLSTLHKCALLIIRNNGCNLMFLSFGGRDPKNLLLCETDVGRQLCWVRSLTITAFHFYGAILGKRRGAPLIGTVMDCVLAAL